MSKFLFGAALVGVGGYAAFPALQEHLKDRRLAANAIQIERLDSDERVLREEAEVFDAINERGKQIAEATDEAPDYTTELVPLSGSKTVRDQGSKARAKAVVTLSAPDGYFIDMATFASSSSGSSDLVYHRNTPSPVPQLVGTDYEKRFVKSVKVVSYSSDHDFFQVHATAVATASAESYPLDWISYFIDRDQEALMAALAEEVVN